MSMTTIWALWTCMPMAMAIPRPGSGRRRPMTGPDTQSAFSPPRSIRCTWTGGAGSTPRSSAIRARSTRSRSARPATSPAVTASTAGSRSSCRRSVSAAGARWQGENYWWGGKADQANAMMTTAAPIAIPAGGASLSFDLVYDIEDQWDFLWVQASEDGDDLEDPDQRQYPVHPRRGLDRRPVRVPGGSVCGGDRRPDRL